MIHHHYTVLSSYRTQHKLFNLIYILCIRKKHSQIIKHVSIYTLFKDHEGKSYENVVTIRVIGDQTTQQPQPNSKPVKPQKKASLF